VRFRLAALIMCSALAAAQTAEDYRTRIAADPASSLAHYEFGVFLLGQNDLQAAAGEFQAALKGDLLPVGVDAQSHEKLSWIFFSNGDMERSVDESRLAHRLEDARNTPRKKEPPETQRRFVPVHAAARISADYTEEARIAGLEGAVFVMCEVGEDGSARRTDVTQPLGLGLDQKAVEAVKQTRFEPATLDGTPVLNVIEVEVDFQLPAKQSRWHLMRVAFDPEEGVTAPVIANAKYPLGAAISANAIEEGRILGAIGRFASATIAFEVDEHGHPRRFTVRNASEQLWGHEAIALVSQWQFRPAMKDGQPVPAQCLLDLIWGPRTLTAESLRESHGISITVSTQH
jgi:TonB family protein